MKGVATSVFLLVALCTAGCGSEEPASPPAAAENAEPVDLKALWKRLVPEAAWTFEFSGEVVSKDGDKTTVVHRMPLFDRENERGDHLEGIELPENATKQQVREYVAQILGAAIRARRGQGYGSWHPEIKLLERVGPDHADILLEPLLHLERLGPGLYLVEALKDVADWMHKKMVLAFLPDAHELISVVVDKRWTKAAAPTLLRALAGRARKLYPGWVVAAAEVARPEHYDDLRRHMAEGNSPLRIWEAIRELPGMEPLDAFVEQTWRKATEEESGYRWHELAVIAAHYGHVDALEAYARQLPDKFWFWERFRALTGYGSRLVTRAQLEDAEAWVVQHKDKLVFDRGNRRYRMK